MTRCCVLLVSLLVLCGCRPLPGDEDPLPDPKGRWFQVVTASLLSEWPDGDCILLLTVQHVPDRLVIPVSPKVCVQVRAQQ